MRCPHCDDSFTPQWAELGLLKDTDAHGNWTLRFTQCPSCDRMVAEIFDKWVDEHNIIRFDPLLPAYPALISRPLPEEVEAPYAQDFREASICLAISPKASAALS